MSIRAIGKESSEAQETKDSSKELEKEELVKQKANESGEDNCPPQRQLALLCD